MPFVICSQHGGHVATLVCPHIAERVRDGQPVTDVCRVEAVDEPDWAWVVHLCAACAAARGCRQPTTVLRGPENFDALYSMEQTPVCRFCFAMYAGGGARST